MPTTPTNTHAKSGEYCYNCGASNATKSSRVTVGYAVGGGSSFVKDERPHCDDCANVNAWGSNIFFIIILAVGAIFLAGYIYDSLRY